jgi:hypothetical protein
LFPVISGNRIFDVDEQGILFNDYVVSAQIIGNTILDCCMGSPAGELSAAIRQTGFSFGTTLIGNTIGNTAFGGGLATYGITNASNATARILKDIIANNSFIGIANDNQMHRQWTVSPTSGIFDINKNDFVANSTIAASSNPGWHCVAAYTPSLSSNASSASTTVVVSSTSGFAAGDIVLLLKGSNPYLSITVGIDAGYCRDADNHIDTIASVTNGTDFVLTTGIPAGDGNYEAGIAFVKIARFKAAAAIAA